MKVTTTTEFKMDFAMKDGKKVHTFKLTAKDESEARAILTDEMGQILDQIELEDRKEKEREDKKHGAA